MQRVFIINWPTLAIEHAVTDDDAFDGNPVLPGTVEDDVFWARVKGLPGARTLWRRIFISSSPATEWRAASGDQTRAP